MLRSYATFLTLTTGWCYINAIRFYCFLILEFVFPCDGNPFDKSLHGCFSETVLSGVGSLGVVGVHPRIEVCLQLLNRGIDFLSKCDCIELVLPGSVESLADAVCLRAFRLDFRVVYILHSQIQFIFVVFSVSAVFRSSVCEHTHQLQVMLLEERHYPVIEHIGSDKGVLPVV